MRFHFHKYNAWSAPVEAYSGRLQQWRKCEVCNRADFRTLLWHQQTSLACVLAALRSSGASAAKEGE